MKKLAILAVFVGVAAGSYGQGLFNFDNSAIYDGTANSHLAFIGANGKAGQGAIGAVIGSGGSFNYDMGFLYSTDTSFVGTSTPGNAAFFAAASNTGFKSAFAAQTGDLVNGAGILEGGLTSINGTADGQHVSLQLIAWFDPNGSTTFAQSMAAGNNIGWSSIMDFRLATGNDQVVADLSGVPGFAVQAVPEPTTFALAGLGAAALMIIRRRK